MFQPDYWTRWRSHERLMEDCLSGDHWLAAREQSEQQRYRDSERRLHWRHGRWLTKQLLRETVLTENVDAERIAVLSRDPQGRAVRPQVWLDDAPLSIAVSISHSQSSVLVGVVSGTAVRIGVDLAIPEHVSTKALVFWFTEQERRRVDGDPMRMAECWAVKEAVYKCVNRGESFVPGRFQTELDHPHGPRCRYNGEIIASESQLQIVHTDSEIAVTALARDETVPVDAHEWNATPLPETTEDLVAAPAERQLSEANPFRVRPLEKSGNV